MVRIYGASDDLVEIENSKYKEDEIGCYNHDVLMEFTDGTIIRVGYSKPKIAVWYIKYEKRGTADSVLTVCNDEEAEIYSDIFEIYAEIVKHTIIDRM